MKKKINLALLLLVVLLSTFSITYLNLEEPVVVDGGFFLGQSHKDCHLALNTRFYRDPTPLVATGVNEIVCVRDEKESGAQAQLRIRYSKSGNIEFLGGRGLPLSYKGRTIHPGESSLTDVESIFGKPTWAKDTKSGEAVLCYKNEKLELEFQEGKFVAFQLGKF